MMLLCSEYALLDITEGGDFSVRGRGYMKIHRT